MKTIFKIFLFIITAGVIIILVDTAMVDSGDEITISNTTNSSDDNIESVSPFDVFEDTKDQLESGIYPDKDTLPRCKRDGKVEYGIDGKKCKTSSEQILTCIDGVAKLNNGIMGKELYLGSFDLTLKCKTSE